MSFATPSRDRPSPTLPLAPMIDMMFLTLIFFMWSAATREEQREIPVQLQEAHGSEPARSAAPIYVTITPANEVFVGQVSYRLETKEDIDRFRHVMAALAATLPGETTAQRQARLARTPVVIRSDRGSTSGTLLLVISAARSAGFVNVVAEAKKPADTP
jgi:biopolymer transport protein ExbD